jgi:hypothetical protein
MLVSRTPEARSVSWGRVSVAGGVKVALAARVPVVEVVAPG